MFQRDFQAWVRERLFVNILSFFFLEMLLFAEDQLTGAVGPLAGGPERGSETKPPDTSILPQCVTLPASPMHSHGFSPGWGRVGGRGRGAAGNQILVPIQPLSLASQGMPGEAFGSPSRVPTLAPVSRGTVCTGGPPFVDGELRLGEGM